MIRRNIYLSLSVLLIAFGASAKEIKLRPAWLS